MRTTLRTTLVVALLVVAGQVSVLVTGAWTWAWLTVPVLGLVAYLDLRVGIGALGAVTVISVAGGVATPPDSWGLAVAVRGLVDKLQKVAALVGAGTQVGEQVVRRFAAGVVPAEDHGVGFER